jgi:hypothetical protein
MGVMATRYLIMLVSDLQALPDPIGRRFKGRLLRMGRPLIERAGVVSRRVLWAHAFPDEWPSGLRDDITMDDDTIVRANLVDAFPANWRYPVFEVPQP